MDVDKFIGREVVAMGLTAFPGRDGITSATMRCKNGEKVHISNAVVIIDDGTVIGDNNAVVGDNNRVVGASCRAIGSHNVIISTGGTVRNHSTNLGRSGRLDLSALKPAPRFDQPVSLPGGVIMTMHDAGEAADYSAQVDPATGMLEEKRPKRATRRPRRIASAAAPTPAAKRGASPLAKRIEPKRRGKD